jgi:Stress responsive A/B Barrel Domain
MIWPRGGAVFRQVVAIRWAESVSVEDKQGFRDALDSLRSIPEVLSLTWGDDAGHFEGNFDLVAVMDFADFDTARVYVQHPLHQAYIRDHAAKVVGERVIVQHDWTTPLQVDADTPPSSLRRRRD